MNACHGLACYSIHSNEVSVKTAASLTKGHGHDACFCCTDNIWQVVYDAC